MRSLYTNIPYTEGIEAVRKSLQKSKTSISLSIIISFLKLILTLNNFVFNSVNYLQKKGCVMGWFEEHFIYPLILRFGKFCLRYIDDMFLIWNGTQEKFEAVVDKINNCHPTIKFEYQISNTEINFLDTTVFKVGNQLRTKLYTKPSH